MNSLYMYSGEICVADVRKRREEILRKVMKSIEAKRDAANFSDPKALLLNTVLELQKYVRNLFIIFQHMEPRIQFV